jgi:2-succinyl-6-hydroxy-2,4-cyclohexadiene-1-carboxylate synthase
LLHGFTGAPSSFSTLLERLPAERAFCPLLLGHAGDASLASSFEAEVDRLYALLDPGRRYHVIGYSLGARLALGLLVRHPTAFAAGTLIGLNPGLRDQSARDARRGLEAEWCTLLRSRGVAAFVEHWEKQPLFASQNRLSEAVLQAQRRTRLSHSAEGLCRSLEATGLGTMPSYWEKLSTLDIPLSLVAGAQDSRFVELAQQARELLPRARVVTVAEAGHNLLLERPDALAALVFERAGAARGQAPILFER